MKHDNDMNAQNGQQAAYEEPLLLGAEDLKDVAGGCWFGCSDGSCGSKTTK